jgi:hypothetical protein
MKASEMASGEGEGGDVNALAIKIAVHEAVCAERWKAAVTRLGRIEMVLITIVLLLLFGEGSVLEVVKRLIAR